MKMHDCPKFDSCSATLCPLDKGLRKRSYLPGERVCHYITMYSKPHEIDNIRGSLPIELFRAVESSYPYISNHNANIRNRLKASSITPAKGFK